MNHRRREAAGSVGRENSARKLLGRLLLATFAMVLLPACATSPGEEGEQAGGEALEASSEGGGLRFVLAGDELEVVAASDEDASEGRLLDGDVEPFCGTRDEFGPFGASARTADVLERTDSRVRVRLSKDVSGEVAFCGLEGPNGEAFAYFVPEEELGSPP